MPDHEKINYIEYPARDLEATKTFFSHVFGWKFTDYGPDYMSFDYQGVEGGFYQAELVSLSENGAALTIFYSGDLETTQSKVEAAGGQVTQPIFDFPGGRRFHFLEPSGSEFAVWGESQALKSS